jgi:hypothetical protein
LHQWGRELGTAGAVERRGAVVRDPRCTRVRLANGGAPGKLILRMQSAQCADLEQPCIRTGASDTAPVAQSCTLLVSLGIVSVRDDSTERGSVTRSNLRISARCRCGRGYWHSRVAAGHKPAFLGRIANWIPQARLLPRHARHQGGDLPSATWRLARLLSLTRPCRPSPRCAQAIPFAAAEAAQVGRLPICATTACPRDGCRPPVRSSSAGSRSFPLRPDPAAAFGGRPCPGNGIGSSIAMTWVTQRAATGLVETVVDPNSESGTVRCYRIVWEP